MRYAWKPGGGDSGISPGTPLWKPRSTACRGRWPAGSKSGERPVERYIRIPRSWRPIAVEDNHAGDEISYSISSLVNPGGIALSDSEKAVVLADNLEAQFQPATDPSIQAFIETVDVALRSYFLSPTSEPLVNHPWRGSRSHQGSQVKQGSGPERYTEQDIEAPSKTSGFPPRPIFNAVLRTHQFPQTRKHARVISILTPRKDPALSSFYRPISLLETNAKLFEKILLARILHLVNERELMRGEQLGFRPRNSTSLQLARLVERITRNFGE